MNSKKKFNFYNSKSLMLKAMWFSILISNKIDFRKNTEFTDLMNLGENYLNNLILNKNKFLQITKSKHQGNNTNIRIN